MSALFVTSTGTDIGKTFVAAALIRRLRRAGHAVEAIKPVVSGFDPAAAASSDPGALLAALERPVTPEEIARITPWRFRAPLSPDMAAQREGSTIDFDALVEFSQRAVEASSGTLLIEGVGGVMAPLDDEHTVIDWMMALKLPLLLVVGSYLGTISHTLTAIDSLYRRDLRVRALIVSASEGSPVALDQTVAAIARQVEPINVLGVPRLPHGTTEHPVFEALATPLGAVASGG